MIEQIREKTPKTGIYLITGILLGGTYGLLTNGIEGMLVGGLLGGLLFFVFSRTSQACTPSYYQDT